MIEPRHDKLAHAWYDIRLEEAALARRQHAARVATPGMLDTLQASIGRQLVALGERMQTPATRRHAVR